MKYLNLYENFDWNEDDFDFEEEEYQQYGIPDTNSEYVIDWRGNKVPTKDVVWCEFDKVFCLKDEAIWVDLLKFYTRPQGLRENMDWDWDWDEEEDDTVINNTIYNGIIAKLYYDEGDDEVQFKLMSSHIKPKDTVVFKSELEMDPPMIYDVYNTYEDKFTIIMDGGEESDAKYDIKEIYPVKILNTNKS